MIKLNWANKENSQRPSNFDSEDYIILNVNVLDIMTNSENDFKLDPYDAVGGKNSIGNRLPYALEHFVDGRPMDFSEAYYSPYKKKVGFDNGRHRAVAAFQLGHDYIPMFVFKENIDKFKEMVRTKEYFECPIQDLIQKKSGKKLVFQLENSDEAFISLYELRNNLPDEISDGVNISVYEIEHTNIAENKKSVSLSDIEAKKVDSFNGEKFIIPEIKLSDITLRKPREKNGKLRYF